MSLLDESVSGRLPSESRLECDGLLVNAKFGANESDSRFFEIRIVAFSEWVLNTRPKSLRQDINTTQGHAFRAS